MSIVEGVRPTTFKDSARNILVVDDRQDIIHVIELALEEQPVKVFAANNGWEAMRELEARPYDLLLLDAKMPGMSGFEICRTVKNHEHWHSAKVIMISASTQADDKLRAFEAGADDYVTKPFRVQELKARIQVMLNLRKAERELTQRNEQLLELIRISERLNLRLDLSNTANEIVKSATRLTKADRAYLLLWDVEKRQHYFAAAENPSENFKGVLERPIPEGVGIAALVQQSGGLIIVADYQNFEHRIPWMRVESHETAGIPLRIGDRHIGALIVTLSELESHFAPANLDILPTLANQAAIAIENARLYTELNRENDKYRLITEKASDLIISLDNTGVLTYVNERVQAILGYSPNEMIGRFLERFLAPEGQVAFNHILQDLVRTPSEITPNQHSQPQEVLALSKEGVPINLEFNFGLLYQTGSPNQVMGIQAIGRDVTSRKRSEENERMRVVGQIASGVAHDLNNVLANVLGHAQLLKTDTEDPEILETVQIIEQAALDGAETVRRIQEFTVQRMQQNLDLVDLNTVVQSTIDLSRPRWRDDAQQKGMQIEVERELTAIPTVRGKAAELREVLINLVNNAIDAMPPQGGSIKFRTYLESPSQTVCLEVTDSGKGMTSEVRRHIFEPFYTTKGVRGTGLGLSVAYGIIKRFGGEISVESVLNQGTIFYIRLPIATNQREEPDTAREKSLDKKVRPRYQGRILAVDDEPHLRTIFQRALSHAGFEVTTASNGIEALELLMQAAATHSDLPYDLLLSDLGMPEMSGWELAQETSRRWPDLPVVLVTGWGEQLDDNRLAEYNIARTIAKPFNIHELVQLAANLITQQEIR